MNRNAEGVATRRRQVVRFDDVQRDRPGMQLVLEVSAACEELPPGRYVLTGGYGPESRSWLAYVDEATPRALKRASNVLFNLADHGKLADADALAARECVHDVDRVIVGMGANPMVAPL